jgi:drug/metabolite transporter (DMT)-like permease
MKQLTGIAIILASTISYALLSALLKKVYKNDVGPFTVMAISMLVLFLISAVCAFVFEDFSNFEVAEHTKDILLLVLVGTINALGFWLAIKGYDYMPLWEQQMFQILTPLLTGFFAFFMLGESIGINLFIGLGVMGIGLFIAIR